MNRIRRFCCDDETGEVFTYDINEETGEPFIENYALPPETNQPNTSEPSLKQSEKYMKFPSGYISKTKKFQSLKASIIAGSNPISHRMLLIPSLMIFPGLFCIILMILEIALHVRCHKKNKFLKDPNLYYQSPFHVVTSIFCGNCRESNSASKIGQLQDKRRNRYDYFKGIAG